MSPFRSTTWLDRSPDDHFLLWDGCRQKVDQSEGTDEMLKRTGGMLARDALIKQELIDKAKSRQDYQCRRHR